MSHFLSHRLRLILLRTTCISDSSFAFASKFENKQADKMAATCIRFQDAPHFRQPEKWLHRKYGPEDTGKLRQLTPHNIMELDREGERPETGKKAEDYRIFNMENTMLAKQYHLMHTYQSVDFAKRRREKWCRLDHSEMTLMEACDLLNTFVDECDPDHNDLPNTIHAYQTAERIREAHPDMDWFHLTGFIHDLGKVLGMWGEEQWATGGDTFPVGCEFSDKNVYGKESFKGNPDYNHDVYRTKLGIYEENCGLEKVLMSWGHDEYLYRVMKGNPNCRLPEEALYIIRFHSFYPWHDKDQYFYLCNEKDMKMRKWVKEFSKFDNYSKSEDIPDIDVLKPYYQSLIDKYCPGKIKW